MSTQTATKVNPITYMRNLSLTQSWETSKADLKRVYQLTRSKLTESQRDTLLCEIYSNISISCPDGICSYWRFMNN